MPSTRRAGVMRLPEGSLRGAVSPERRSFTLVPPMSIARIVLGGEAGAEAGTATRLAGVEPLAAERDDFMAGLFSVKRPRRQSAADALLSIVSESKPHSRGGSPF